MTCRKRQMIAETDKDLIAPCGMNCGICSNYLAYSHQLPKRRGKICHCSGCRPNNKQCSFIKKRCESVRNNTVEFCYQCNEFPCDILHHLVKGYVKRYNYSVIDNLMFIKENGPGEFILREKDRFACPRCGDTLCVHNRKCYTCDREELIRD